MEVTGISGIRIEMPNEAKISIFTDNDLTHITDDHFEIKLIARLLDQIYAVPSPQSPLRYDDTPSDTMSFTQTVDKPYFKKSMYIIIIMHTILHLHVLLSIIDGIIF